MNSLDQLYGVEPLHACIGDEEIQLGGAAGQLVGGVAVVRCVDDVAGVPERIRDLGEQFRIVVRSNDAPLWVFGRVLSHGIRVDRS